MAAVYTTNSVNKHLIDYLRRRLPPYMHARIATDPFRAALQLRIDTKLAVHFTDDPNPDQFVTATFAREMMLIQDAAKVDTATLDRSVQQMMKETAKAIAKGDMSGRRFDKFAFEGGTVQELAQPAPDNVIDLRPMQIKTEADITRTIYNAKNNNQRTDTLWCTPSQQAQIIQFIKSMVKPGSRSGALYIYGHKVEVKH